MLDSEYIEYPLINSSLTTLIDKKYLEYIYNFKWYLAKRKDHGKIHTYVITYNFPQYKKGTCLHRIIYAKNLGLNNPKELGFEIKIDHINHNQLDNRIENLRASDNQQNTAHQRLHCNNTSGYKGVSKKNNRWGALICPNRQHIHLGYFDTKEEAALAYNIAALYHFKEFAKLNPVETKIVDVDIAYKELIANIKRRNKLITL